MCYGTKNCLQASTQVSVYLQHASLHSLPLFRTNRKPKKYQLFRLYSLKLRYPWARSVYHQNTPMSFLKKPRQYCDPEVSPFCRGRTSMERLFQWVCVCSCKPHENVWTSAIARSGFPKTVKLQLQSISEFYMNFAAPSRLSTKRGLLTEQDQNDSKQAPHRCF